jgi:hypothetical protein
MPGAPPPAPAKKGGIGAYFAAHKKAAPIAAIGLGAVLVVIQKLRSSSSTAATTAAATPTTTTGTVYPPGATYTDGLQQQLNALQSQLESGGFTSSGATGSPGTTSSGATTPLAAAAAAGLEALPAGGVATTTLEQEQIPIYLFDPTTGKFNPDPYGQNTIEPGGVAPGMLFVPAGSPLPTAIPYNVQPSAGVPAGTAAA